MMMDLEQLKADREAGTDGPWGWFGNARMHQIYLATKHSGRRYVMGFRRWGMRGAQPVFQPSNRGLVPASDLVQFEVGDRGVVGVDAAKANDSVYRLDIRGVDCADARRIARLPELETAYIEVVAKLDKAVEALKEVDDTLAKLSGSLAELDAALLAQEIAVIAQDRESIAAIKGPSHE